MIHFHLSRNRFSIKKLNKTEDIIPTFPLNREECTEFTMIPLNLCLITKARNNFLFESRLF